jgi:hypothetical protein
MLSATGPYLGMGTEQFIITITSSTACQIRGYPVLAFSGVSTSAQAPLVVNGGTAGNADPQSAVAVGPGQTASFLLQTNGDDCPTASQLMFGLPGTTASVVVSLTPPIASSWNACPTVYVTPFEQGNSPDRYA